MQDCTNYADIIGNTYASAFYGYYPLPLDLNAYPNDAEITFDNCVNHGNINLRYAGPVSYTHLDTIEPYLIGKGGGSAYGGAWKPSKPDDGRFIGEPGSINRTTDRNGNLRETKIGADGRAVKERHYSDHGSPKQHSIPHDHTISWEGNRPNWGKARCV